MSYPYEPQGQYPDAPFMQILLRNPGDPRRKRACKALLDTGADSTHVPVQVLRNIGVNSIGREVTFLGVGGEAKYKPYIVSVKLDERDFGEIRVWGWEGDFVLLGRDLLNACCVEFNGPKLLFEFNEASL